MRAMVGEALLLLIQKPSALSTLDCPEALILDLQRLVATQNELQRLSLIGASLLVAQMLLGAKGLPSTPLTAENRRYQLSPRSVLPLSFSRGCTLSAVHSHLATSTLM